MSLRPLASWDCGFESRRQYGYAYLFLMTSMCCQVDVSASGWSLGERILTECGVSSEWDREASIVGRTWPTRNCCATGGEEASLLCFIN